MDDITKHMKFDGTPGNNFRRWQVKMLAYGGLRDNFSEAFTTKDYDIQNDSKKAERSIIAWHNLILCLEGAPLMYVTASGSEVPYEAWELLKAKYSPSQVEDYARLSSDFQQCELDDPYEDPEVWIVRLININTQLGSINKTYLHDDVQMVIHILNKIPKELYGHFRQSYQIQSITGLTMAILQTKLTNYWKENVIKHTGDNMAMVVENVKPAAKDQKDEVISQLQEQIKECVTMMTAMKTEQQQRKDPQAWGVKICSNCGRTGHEFATCRGFGGPAYTGGRGGGRGYNQGYQQNYGSRGYQQQNQGYNSYRPPRTCYKCNQEGHVIANCPLNIMPNQQGNNYGGQMYQMQPQQNQMYGGHQTGGQTQGTPMTGPQYQYPAITAQPNAQTQMQQAPQPLQNQLALIETVNTNQHMNNPEMSQTTEETPFMQVTTLYHKDINLEHSEDQVYMPEKQKKQVSLINLLRENTLNQPLQAFSSA